MSEDFSNAPVTIAQLRAEADGDCSKWTPRDALVDMLRRIDSGKENPSHIVICFREPDGEGGWIVGHQQAGSDPHVLIGIVTRVQFLLQSKE